MGGYPTPEPKSTKKRPSPSVRRSGRLFYRAIPAASRPRPSSPLFSLDFGGRCRALSPLYPISVLVRPCLAVVSDYFQSALAFRGVGCGCSLLLCCPPRQSSRSGIRIGNRTGTVNKRGVRRTGRIFKVGIRKHATSKVKKCE